MTNAILKYNLPYQYQHLTHLNCSVSRHASVKTFFHISRIRSVILRFTDITLSIPHMNYFSTRFRFINLHRIQFCWVPSVNQSKSRRWRRRFGKRWRPMYGRILLTPMQFFSFWTMFISIFMARRVFFPLKRRIGSGNHLFHWFGRHELFWEYPAVPSKFFFNARARRDKNNFYLKILLSRTTRQSFMMDRDLFRLLNFPISYYNVPRMWQADPATFVSHLRFKKGVTQAFHYQAYLQKVARIALKTRKR